MIGVASSAIENKKLILSRGSCGIIARTLVRRMDESSTTLSASPARCLRCGVELARLHPGGRYCPRCGLDTLSSPPASLVSPAPAGSGDRLVKDHEWSHLFQFIRDTTDAELPERVKTAPEEHSSEIVRGYSAALYRLGRRYDSGLHAGGKNSREALRCYAKAARLGHVLAFARLASRWANPAHELQPGLPDSPSPRHGQI